MKILFLDIDGVLNFWRTEQNGWIEGEFASQADLDALETAPDVYRLVGGNPRGASREQILLFDLNQIDRPAIQLLNKVVEATGCKIVISSSWRIMVSQQGLQWLLSAKGFVGEIVGVTQNYSEIPESSESGLIIAKQRGHEISDYIELMKSIHKDSEIKFAIVDDVDEMLHLKDHFVQTNPEFGLRQQAVDKLIEILK